MVPVTSLWLPILVSAVIVFVASAIIHMVLPYHRGDLRKIAKEEEVQEALRRFNLPPGDYALPHAGTPAEMKDPRFVERRSKGPVVLMTVIQPGPPAMGRELTLWFIFTIVVSIFAAYIAGRAVGPGGDYLQVFRFAGCTAFVGHSLALADNSIWFHRNWGMTIKSMIDGLIYGLLTGGTFGWLWPR
jgi:hypothetical protein